MNTPYDLMTPVTPPKHSVLEQLHYSVNTNFAGIPDDTPPVILKPDGRLVMSFNSIFKNQDRMGTEELDRFNKNHLKFNIYARINGKKFYGRIDLSSQQS